MSTLVATQYVMPLSSPAQQAPLMGIDDSWDEASFGEDSFANDDISLDLDDLKQELPEEKAHSGENHFDHDSRKESIPKDIDVPPPPPKAGVDTSPHMPRRAAKGQKKLLAKAMEDRFGLSQSEHMSQTLDAPRCPRRHSNDAKRNSSGRPTLSRNHSSGRPAISRTRSGLARPRSRTPTKGSPLSGSHSRLLGRSEHGHIRSGSRRNLLGNSEHGQVTLRGSDNRVLLGTRELSTSQHLKRRCPRRGADEQ